MVSQVDFGGAFLWRKDGCVEASDYVFNTFSAGLDQRFDIVNLLNTAGMIGHHHGQRARVIHTPFTLNASFDKLNGGMPRFFNYELLELAKLSERRDYAHYSRIPHANVHECMEK